MARIVVILIALIGLVLYGQGVNGSNPGFSPLSGITPAIGGSLLTVGVPLTQTVTVTGAATSMVCVMDPSAGNALIVSVIADCYVSASNTVTVRLTSLIVGITPTSQTYSIRVIP